MLKKGVSNLVGQIIRMATTIISIPILISLLGTELYGLWTWSTTIISIFQLSEAGLSSGLIYFLSKNEHSTELKNQTLTNSIVLLLVSILFVILTILSFSFLLINLLPSSAQRYELELSIVLELGSILIALRIIQNLYWSILQSKQRYELLNVFQTVQIVTINASFIILAYFKLTYLPYFIIASIIITIITIIILLKFLNILQNFNWSFEISNFKTFVKYNLRIWGGSIGSSIFTHGDKMLIASLLGPSVLTVYTVFTNICIQLNQLTAQVAHPIFPLISSYQEDNKANPNQIFKSFLKVFVLNITVSFGGSLFLICFSEEILIFFLKENFKYEYIRLVAMEK
ncbi:oligosaccharide flippase family protein [Arundinibacter roseus]|uniref:Lipopolysaccharide biosynthesis protein n=1 Tax=Arundinibacter roseus TaxID=2070510 RepID=A0A4R4KME2_9BACT|nr:oligosaccharide flippase family protein [Arundinibacter roseus]TDB67829.1 hypothetical protein EZE20_02585 [Arundinibacter roseus]